MFHGDVPGNRLVRLEERRFAALNLREREHLQDWLVRMPDALGEELPIIQKEFDGFADTRERLDVLALDKEGRLVVVENKLDDSGRDFVWQALKYVAYCSSLKKAEIVEIYQSYLNRWSDGASPRSPSQAPSGAAAHWIRTRKTTKITDPGELERREEHGQRSRNSCHTWDGPTGNGLC